MSGHIITVYAIFKQDNKVLLQRRQNTGFGDGFYSLPAGHVEEGENVQDALIREVREEIGISLNRENISFSCFLHTFAPHNAYLKFFFLVSSWQGTPKICELNKASDLGFFPIDSLPSNTLDYISYALSCTEKKVHEGYLGWNEMNTEKE